MPKVYIIIVNYHSEDVIADAIASFDEEYLDHKVVILDNGSTDESYKKLRKVVGNDIEIIRSDKNLGYSAGANHVAKYIKDTYGDHEYFFFFNPDAEATKNMLTTLLDSLKSYPEAAAVSPLILDMKGERWFSGTQIDWERCQINNNPDTDDPSKTRKIDTFNGCAVLMDAKRFFEVGMFNEDLFIYYDEPFIAMEFLQKGYICLYEPKTIAYHHVSHSAGSYSTFKDRLMHRNHIYFFKKYGNNSSFLCPYKRSIRIMLFYLKRLKFGNIKAIIYGIIDATKGRKGLV